MFPSHDQQGKVVGVDYQWDHSENVEYIKNKHSHFKFVLGDSIEQAQNIYKTFGKVDLLFVDTDHVYHRTIDEFNAWRPYLSKNAIVCFDDLFRHHPVHAKGMTEAWNDLPGEKLRLDFLHDGSYPYGGGFGCMWGF